MQSPPAPMLTGDGSDVFAGVFFDFFALAAVAVPPRPEGHHTQC